MIGTWPTVSTQGGRRIIHVGGGIVPTRRPLPSLVANGFLAAGDAAVTVNPVHGGGIGPPALLSAELASKTVIEAFEKSDFRREGCGGTILSI